MVEALCQSCGKRLLTSPDATQCFLCGGELKFRQIPQTEKPDQKVLKKIVERVGEIAEANPQVKKGLEKAVKEWRY